MAWHRQKMVKRSGEYSSPGIPHGLKNQSSAPACIWPECKLDPLSRNQSIAAFQLHVVSLVTADV